jgi:hypothetical protein
MDDFTSPELKSVVISENAKDPRRLEDAINKAIEREKDRGYQYKSIHITSASVSSFTASN